MQIYTIDESFTLAAPHQTNGVFIVIIYPSVLQALPLFSLCLSIRAGSTDGCEIKLSAIPTPPPRHPNTLPPSPQPPLTSEGFNDHEAGKHSKWQTCN